MTREKFIKVLDEKAFSYEMEGDKLVVTDKEWDVGLEKLKTLPPGVVFKNASGVFLDSLTSLPPGVVFGNGGSVYLNALTSIPPGVELNNGDAVYLRSLTSLPPGMEFRNKGRVHLESLTGEWFDYWEGNIEDIDNKRLLNFMISKEMFI
jgi:hypothetical protein